MLGDGLGFDSLVTRGFRDNVVYHIAEKPMFKAVLLAILALLVVACGEGSTTAELSMVETVYSP